MRGMCSMGSAVIAAHSLGRSTGTTTKARIQHRIAINIQKIKTTHQTLAQRWKQRTWEAGL
jgi:hypothetical protein